MYSLLILLIILAFSLTMLSLSQLTDNHKKSIIWGRTTFVVFVLLIIDVIKVLFF